MADLERRAIRKWRARREPEQFWREVRRLELITVASPDENLVELRVAAEMLGVSRPTMTGFLDRGTLSAVHRSGSSKRWVFRSEVEQLIANRSGG